jgi:hypothetical protein
MSENRPDGLARLTAQRDRARRSMPAPRHPVVAAPEQRSEPTAPVPALISEIPPVPTRPAVSAGAPRPGSAVEETGATFKVTLYLDRETDEFMEAVRVEGLTSRPKVDVSRSAVVRLALRRLMDEMGPGEVKALLEGQAVRSTGPGRRRR